jgi:hypothetical protein
MLMGATTLVAVVVSNSNCGNLSAAEGLPYVITAFSAFSSSFRFYG